jgi:hypothetical protein
MESIRRHAMRPRLIAAVAIAAFGAISCIASDEVFGRSQPYGSTIGLGWDLLLALPFLLVGIAVLFTGMSMVAAVVTAIALGVLVVLSYHSANTDSSSTASIALLAPWMTGVPLVLVAWIVDAGVRAGRDWRGWRRDGRRV